MKNYTLLILLSLTFNSFSQISYETEYSKRQQISYKDSIEKVRKLLLGKWKYLGKNHNNTLIDTTSSVDNRFVIVDNGVLYIVENDIKKKEEFYFITKYSANSYSDEWEYYDPNKKLGFSCIPKYKLIYHNNKIGILSKGLGGEDFRAISYITTKKLIFEDRKEYLKLK